jgi:hypothetical protein
MVHHMAKGTPKSAVKSSAEKRTKRYTVSYNEDEDSLVSDAANEKSLEVASWIRMVSVEAARASKKKSD